MKPQTVLPNFITEVFLAGRRTLGMDETQARGPFVALFSVWLFYLRFCCTGVPVDVFKKRSSKPQSV